MRKLAAASVLIVAGLICSEVWASNDRKKTVDLETQLSSQNALTQIAEGGNRLPGGQIKALLVGRTTQLKPKRRGGKMLTFKLRFGRDGTFEHVCTAEWISLKTQAHRTAACTKPSDKGRWVVRGNKLCVVTDRQRCYFVVKTGAGHALKTVSGKRSPYSGSFSLAR